VLGARLRCGGREEVGGKPHQHAVDFKREDIIELGFGKPVPTPTVSSASARVNTQVNSVQAELRFEARLDDGSL
jgi:hypothetical protein